LNGIANSLLFAMDFGVACASQHVDDFDFPKERRAILVYRYRSECGD
jgi:hypothetical protein